MSVLSKLLDKDKDQAYLVTNAINGSVIGVFGGSAIDVDENSFARITNLLEEEFGMTFSIVNVEEANGITFDIVNKEEDFNQSIGLTRTWIY